MDMTSYSGSQSPFSTMQDIATAPAPGAFSIPRAGMSTMAQGGWLPPSMTCPPGLEYLIAVDYLSVQQQLKLTEAFTGSKKKYLVMNIRGETVFYAVEQSGLCARWCMGSYRSCKFHILDNNRREILRMVRPIRCHSCCCPCWLQELEVYSGDVLLGSVSQNWSLWRPSFSIRDANGEIVLIIKRSICIDVTFKVKSTDGIHKLGEIKKEPKRLGRERWLDTNNFDICFPLDLDVKIKAVLLGACLLIDFMHFGQKT